MMIDELEAEKQEQDEKQEQHGVSASLVKQEAWTDLRPSDFISNNHIRISNHNQITSGE